MAEHDMTRADYESPNYRLRGNGKFRVVVFSQSTMTYNTEQYKKNLVERSGREEMDIDANILLEMFQKKYGMDTDTDFTVYHGKTADEVKEKIGKIGNKQENKKYDAFFFVFLTFMYSAPGRRAEESEADQQIYFRDSNATLSDLLDAVVGSTKEAFHLRPKIFIVQADDLRNYPRVPTKGPTLYEEVKMPSDSDRLVIMSAIPQNISQYLKYQSRQNVVTLRGPQPDPPSVIKTQDKNRSSLLIQAFVEVMENPAFNNDDIFSKTPYINKVFKNKLADLMLDEKIYEHSEFLLPLITSTLTKFLNMRHC